MIEGLVYSQTEFMNNQRTTNTEVSDSLRNLNNKIEFLATQNKMLETQIAQQAASSSRPQGTLPGKPDINPREYANTVTLRNGKKYEGPKMPEEDEQQQTQKEAQTAPADPSAAAQSQSTDAQKGVDLQKPGNSAPNKVKNAETPKYIPPHRFVPFPQRLVKNKLDQQFAKFQEHLKKLNITIPFTEVITQMPTYAKFLKDILSKKRTLEEVGTVSLNEECSALFSSKLPPKLKDPGSFAIPCMIGETKFDRCLCDLGASVSLMPKSVYQRLSLVELKPTRMSLQLADKSVRFPEGIIEDVIVQIGKYFVPVDFVVVEMEEDTHTSLLLGRDFLITAGANIDVKEGKISFNIGGEKVEFHMSHAMKFPSNDNDSICRVEVLESIVAAQIEGDTTNEQLDQILGEIGPEQKQTCEDEPECGRTENPCGRTQLQYSHKRLCDRTEGQCGRTHPESYQTEEMLDPTALPKQVREDSLKTKSVVTPETDGMKGFKKGDQVWFSKTKLMNFVEKLKLKYKRKFRENWSEPFKITTTYPTGGMEVWSMKTGSFKVKKKFIKHFLPDKFVKAGHWEVLPNN